MAIGRESSAAVRRVALSSSFEASIEQVIYMKMRKSQLCFTANFTRFAPCAGQRFLLMAHC